MKYSIAFLLCWLFVLFLVGCYPDEGFIYDDVPPAWAQTPSLVKNPSFDSPRGFDFWETEGCMTYVISPKPGGAKAGPPKHTGTCSPGDTASIWQSFPVTDTEVIEFSYYEILKGDSHITVTFDDGTGWQWVARDTVAQNNGGFTSVVTSTIPAYTDWLTITIGFHYCPGLGEHVACGIGSKVTAVSVTSE